MTDLTEIVARAIYDALEGPVANQDAVRQARQWERAQMLAAAALPHILAHIDTLNAERDAAIAIRAENARLREALEALEAICARR